MGMAQISKQALFAAFLIAASASAGVARADCACVNRDGARYNLGETTCIRVDGRSYMAECEMNLNVTSWKKIADDCPQAQAPRQSPWPRQAVL